MEASLDNIKKEYEEVMQQLGDPQLISDWERFDELSKKKKAIEKILEHQKEIDEIKRHIEENKAIMRSGDEPELMALAETELIDLEKKEQFLSGELQNLIAKGIDGNDGESPEGGRTSAIVEIRAGTGGDEAALFAGDLYRMYSRYAVKKNWKTKILDSHATDLSGFKEVIFEVSGSGAYDILQNEAGVHRVQRIPATEKSGRVHTSTATVAVLSKPKASAIKINPADLKIDIAKASGPGGQNVNKRMTAVRITHLPSGLMVKSMGERSLPQNKENAMAILSARLQQLKDEENINQVDSKRRTQIGKAQRVEKIRTYNFPQDRVTDHRIKKSWHNLEDIMEGNIDKMTETLKAELKD